MVVVGAGAAGMMCAIEAGKRGRRVLVVDHARAAGEKIRISGGGRCNFTNIHTSAANFISQNPRFCISALRRYRPTDFIALVERHGIGWHEKTLGQLFCDDSARQIVDMLLGEMKRHGVILRLQTAIDGIEKVAAGFRLTLGSSSVACTSLVIATGASAASQNAIGTGVLGGMISATLLAILFVPVFFVFIMRWTGDKQSARANAEAAPAPAE